jgi:hypothetical protein
MIHQCYIAESQRSRLFTSPVYRGFGLYTAVNPDIARSCPELEDPKNQPLLSEYAAMLHLWRNPELDPDSWIGFTSYRQLDKFSTIITDRDGLERLLADVDVVAWGGYRFHDAFTKRPISLAEQSERSHTGIVSLLWKLLLMRNEAMPAHFLQDNAGLFCNYWIMSKANFREYMDWSCPLVRWCLNHFDPYLQSSPRAVSHVLERLFILWYALRQKRVHHLGALQDVACPNPFFGRGALEDAAGGPG